MKWIYQYADLKPEPLREPLINCASCTINSSLSRSSEYSAKLKCCEFSPFWSAFAIGAWISEGGDFKKISEKITNQALVTRMGVLHSRSHRQTPHSLCQFYDKEKLNCSIWSQRPATCATFFCTSNYNDGLKAYGELEDILLKAEADLLFLWFIENNWDLDLWSQWCLYMEKEAPLETIDPQLLMTHFDEAQQYYLQSYFWLKSATKNNLIKKNIKMQVEQIRQLC
jgi:Fe-S-cluster containining protein